MQIDDGLKNWVAPHAAIAKKYNKPLIAYEAGQSLTGDSPVPMEVGVLGLWAGGARQQARLMSLRASVPTRGWRPLQLIA